MGIVVQKFGGKLISTKENMHKIAELIIKSKNEGNSPVVVISAIGNTTDNLQSKINNITSNATKREIDVVLSAGEQISMGLLCIMLNNMGYKTISLTGRQARSTYRLRLYRCKYIKYRLY